MKKQRDKHLLKTIVLVSFFSTKTITSGLSKNSTHRHAIRRVLPKKKQGTQRSTL